MRLFIKSCKVLSFGIKLKFALLTFVLRVLKKAYSLKQENSTTEFSIPTN